MATLTIIRGSAHAIPVTITRNGSPTSIEGATVIWTVKKHLDDGADDSAAAIQKVVTSHTDPTAGQTALQLEKADTQDLAPGLYLWDLQVEWPSGDILTTLVDTIEIKREATRI